MSSRRLRKRSSEPFFNSCPKRWLIVTQKREFSPLINNYSCGIV